MRRAVEWYRTHERLHTGDSLTMAHDALAAYQADIAAGKDSLLMTDSWELSDALNKRIHAQMVAADALTVTAARGHRIGVGDLIISRDNDPTIEVYPLVNDRVDLSKTAGQVRNGQRWCVYAVDPDNNRIAARRIGDDACTAFTGDYLREHITHGYATTIHANQGATAGDELTAGTAHALLGERATRALAYVALTRGRDENHAYLYQTTVGEADHEHSDLTGGVHVASRGTSRDAAAMLRAVLGRDERAQTVMQTAAGTDRAQLPQQVAELVDRHHRTRAQVRADYRVYTEARSDYDLAADLPQLRAEIALLDVAGRGWSPAAGYRTPAETLARLDESTRTAVTAITAGYQAVHSLQLHPGGDKLAALAAIAAAAHHYNRRVLALPATGQAAQYAVEHRYADTTSSPDKARENLHTGRPIAGDAGSLVVIDDADHLDPTLLQWFAERAATTEHQTAAHHHHR